jgi:hypothetical protein
MASNGFSTLDDFRAAAQMEREARAEAVRLPSGLVARLVRPTPMQYLLLTARLPQGLAARIRAGDRVPPSVDEAVQMAQRLVEELRMIFLWPRVPDELKPGVDISEADVDFALRWGRGEIVQSVAPVSSPAKGAAMGTSPLLGGNEVVSHDLAEFPGDRRGTETVTPAGAVGGDVRMPAK